MKKALLVLVGGYIAYFLRDSIPLEISVTAIFLVVFWVFINANAPQLKKMPPGTRFRYAINTFLFTMVLLFVAAMTLYYWPIEGYLYPPILAMFVLLRHPLRWINRLTVKEPQSFGVVSETERGEMVRSKSEKVVADWFHSHNIPYVYEKEISFKDGSKLKYDFYLPKDDIYVEYWGLEDAAGDVGEKYRERKKEKLQQYKENGLKLLEIYPSDLGDLDRVIPSRLRKLRGGGLFAFFRKSPPSHSAIVSSNGDTTFCVNCGEILPSGEKFCNECGAEQL